MSIKTRLRSLAKKTVPDHLMPLLIIMTDDDDETVRRKERAWQEAYGDRIEAAKAAGQTIFGLDFRTGLDYDELTADEPEESP